MLSPDQASYQCLAYCIMKRPSGFLLCVPEGFLPQEELDRGQAATEVDGIGPSFAAPALVVSPTGEWSTPAEAELVPAICGRLVGPGGVAACSGGLRCTLPLHLQGRQPRSVPQSHGYYSPGKGLDCYSGRPCPRSVGVPDCYVHGRASSRTEGQGPGPETPSSAAAGHAAGQNDGLTVGCGVSLGLAQPAAAAQEPGALPAEASTGLPPGNPLLQQPLSATLPFSGGSEEPCCRAGPPPPSQRCIGIGEVPSASTEGTQLTSAVLAQSQALVALVSQLSGSSADPLLETPAERWIPRGCSLRIRSGT